mgnify:CR=1 FL=1
MQSGTYLIASYFPSFTKSQLEQLEHYVALLLETNQQINLISRKNEDQVWVNHILHSLSIAKVVEFKEGQQVLDFGTGGGLPGIPLAIAFPKASFLLVDSIGKKVKAVQAMVDAMKLPNVRTQHIRVEDVPDSFDFAVSRAVTALPRVDEWLKGKLHRGNASGLPNGLVYIKGGDFQEELDQIAKLYRIWEINDFFEEKFFDTKKVVWLDLAR